MQVTQTSVSVTTSDKVQSHCPEFLAMKHCKTIPATMTGIVPQPSTWRTAPTLHMVRAMSAAVDQLRRRQISKSARQMRGAFWLTYIMSAVREKLSARARDTYACTVSIPEE